MERRQQGDNQRALQPIGCQRTRAGWLSVRPPAEQGTPSCLALHLIGCPVLSYLENLRRPASSGYHVL
jgi:hypothetical protein